jgi:hypothetical protein
MASRPQVAYTIDHNGLRLDLAVVELGSLRVHEETMQGHAEELKRGLIERGSLSTPMFVDRATNIVLDGMHRVRTLRELGCRFALVCLVDYSDQRIKLGRWCRTIPKPFGRQDAERIIGGNGASLRLARGVNSTHSTDLLLAFGDGTYVVESPEKELMSVYRLSHRLEQALIGEGYAVGRMGEDDATRYLATGDFSAILCPPVITKEQVVDVVQRGEVFPPKSTRHRIPARPIGVGLPLATLRDEERTLEEVNLSLGKQLKSSRLRRLPPGSTYRGRRFEDTLYVFE